MITTVQTPAAGDDFDGTTNLLGLVDFAALLAGSGMALTESPLIVPIITSISYSNNQTETLGINCFLKPAAAALGTTVRKTIRRPAADINGFNVDGCKIAVPRVVAGTPLVLDPWVLILITTGKTDLASLIVSFYIGPAEGCGC